MLTRSSQQTPPKGEGVLITGCSSGIGRVTAIHLAQHGYVVFATVRKEADAEDLCSLSEPNLIPIYPLDLAKLEQIPHVVETVNGELNRRGKKGLYALTNNAGGSSPAPIELVDLDKFRIELQARVLGSVAIVQAFLPMIRQAGGRIVWIMTPATIPTPYVISIHACDFAVNCIARTLDIELKPWNIPNIMIRCGGIKTPAGLRTTTDVEAILQKGLHERVALYEKALGKWGKDMAEFDEKRTEPEKVAEIVFKALIAKLPKRQYSIGYLARAASFLEAMPQSVADWILKMRF
ncbi:MAG: SDR family NAD(P)-dependent oxidoreductase [Anaerolineales bacterium]|nr:SDR family NAD(P)-dependent oxidoreductase [Anaerolineales bacterium]